MGTSPPHTFALAAQLDEHSDAAAVLALLALSEGRFVLTPDLSVTERQIKTTITGLLFEASRIRDEAHLAS